MTDPSPTPIDRVPDPSAGAGNPSVRIARRGVALDLDQAGTDRAGTDQAITRMLHRAYRGQVEMGLAPLAGRQDVTITRRRCDSGEASVALLDGVREPVGLILLQEVEEAALPAWFLRPNVARFSLFAVDPPHQHLGIGRRLLDHAASRAIELGCTELALSMAAPDTALRAYYERRGYRLVQSWRWPYTNYESLILSRRLVR